MAYPRHLAWIDIETTDLPTLGDFSQVHLLEVGFILTDMALNEIVGFEEVIKLTPEAADSLRANEYTRTMHKESGLIRASASATATMEDVEKEIVSIFEENGLGKGSVMIAGSGVAAFDHPFIKQKMPLLNEYLAYFPYDVGVVRRVTRTMAGRDFVTVKASYGDTKEHRAMADIRAHLEEAKQFQTFFRSL